MDFYDFFQTMPCNVRLLLRPSPKRLLHLVFFIRNYLLRKWKEKKNYEWPQMLWQLQQMKCKTQGFILTNRVEKRTCIKK